MELYIQCDSQRWTEITCTSCRRNGLNRKRRLNTRQTVDCGFASSLLALRVDLRGLRSNLSWIRLTFSSDTRGRPELLPLHKQPICSNWWFQRQMLFLVGGWTLKRRRNARCTAVGDSVLTFATELFFLILAHPVYKMWIKQEPNTLELWSKLHFEEKRTESI